MEFFTCISQYVDGVEWEEEGETPQWEESWGAVDDDYQNKTNTLGSAGPQLSSNGTQSIQQPSNILELFSLLKVSGQRSLVSKTFRFQKSWVLTLSDGQSDQGMGGPRYLAVLWPNKVYLYYY